MHVSIISLMAVNFHIFITFTFYKSDRIKKDTTAGDLSKRKGNAEFEAKQLHDVDIVEANQRILASTLSFSFTFTNSPTYTI